MKIGEYINDELDHRGWSIEDLAKRMPGNKHINELRVFLITCLSDEQLNLDDDTAKKISIGFGVHPDFIGNLYKQLSEGL